MDNAKGVRLVLRFEQAHQNRRGLTTAAQQRIIGRPVVVGGDGDPTERGVVSTASYEAAHGVHSRMPLRTAPDDAHAVFLAVDREL